MKPLTGQLPAYILGSDRLEKTTKAGETDCE
jgi:hypothetical protein